MYAAGARAGGGAAGDPTQAPSLLRQMPKLQPVTSASCDPSNGAPSDFPTTRE